MARHVLKRRVVCFLTSESGGCITVTTELPSLEWTFRARSHPREAHSRKKTLVESDSSRCGEEKILPFSARMEFWRGTPPLRTSVTGSEIPKPSVSVR
jgi:hypothetical protein